MRASFEGCSFWHGLAILPLFLMWMLRHVPPHGARTAVQMSTTARGTQTSGASRARLCTFWTGAAIRPQALTRIAVGALEWIWSVELSPVDQTSAFQTSDLWLVQERIHNCSLEFAAAATGCK